MIKTVGVELEAFVFFLEKSHEGRWHAGPVDVYDWLHQQYGRDEVYTSSGVVVKTDAGRHLIEFAFPPLDLEEIEAIPNFFESTLKELRMPRSWAFAFQGVDPRGLKWDPNEWAPKSRYQAMWEALAKEVDREYREYGFDLRDLWKGVLATARIASTHVHLGLDLGNPKVINLLNYFNRPLGIQSDQSDGLLMYASPTRLAVWYGSWASRRRLPTFNLLDFSEFRSPEEVREYASFRSMEEMVQYWCSIPRLIRKVSKGNAELWKPDLKTRPEPGDPVAEGTIWWFCRPRWSKGTIEIRIADSMRPERVPRYVKEVVARAEQLLDQ